MEEIPEAPDERRAWLEDWAARQAGQLGDGNRLRARVRPRIAAVIERQVERLDPVFDYRLHTARETPTSWGCYVAGPSPWHILPRALRHLGTSGRDVFIDFGCGTGRVVHQAAKRPLKKVVGVEVIPEVAERARGLVATHRHKYRCQSVEVVTGDVAAFRVPDDLTIAYMGQVQGFTREVLDAVLRNLSDSIDRSPRRVRVIYHQPRYGGGTLAATPAVQATERFRLLPDVSFGATAIFESCG